MRPMAEPGAPSLFIANIPVLHAHPNPLDPSKPLLQRLRDRDRPMASPRAADADRQVRLPFRDVLRHEKLQQVERVLEELVSGLRAIQILEYLRIPAGMFPQFGDEVRVRQKS